MTVWTCGVWIERTTPRAAASSAPRPANSRTIVPAGAARVLGAAAAFGAAAALGAAAGLAATALGVATLTGWPAACSARSADCCDAVTAPWARWIAWPRPAVPGAVAVGWLPLSGLFLSTVIQ